MATTKLKTKRCSINTLSNIAHTPKKRTTLSLLAFYLFLTFSCEQKLPEGKTAATFNQNTTTTTTQKSSKKSINPEFSSFGEEPLDDDNTPIDTGNILFANVSPPTIKTANGTPINILGSGFKNKTFRVKIGAIDCAGPSVIRDNLITCLSPTLAQGTYSVTLIETSSLTEWKIKDAINVVSPLDITYVFPRFVLKQGGERVFLRGEGFTEKATITIAGNECTEVTIQTPESLSCLAPAGEVGSNIEIEIKDPIGQSAIYQGAFFYILKSEIADASPKVWNEDGQDALGETTLTIEGTGFVKIDSIKVGEGDCTDIKEVSPSEITCTVPNRAKAKATPNEPAAITVNLADGRAITDNGASGIVYTSTPKVVTVLPSAGVLAGNQIITIFGTGFFGSLDVILRYDATKKVTCNNVDIISDQELQCSVPMAADSGELSGFYKVVVIDEFDNESNDTLTYYYRPKPTIDAANIRAASSAITDLPIVDHAASTTLTIPGTDFFQEGTIAIQILVGETQCASQTVSPAEITCYLPPLPEGDKGQTLDVKVINSDGQSALAENAIKIYDDPTVTNIYLENTTTSVRTDFTSQLVLEIHGQNLMPKATMVFGDISRTEAICTYLPDTPHDDTRLRCQLEPLDIYGLFFALSRFFIGFVDFFIENPGGQSVSYLADEHQLFDFRHQDPVINQVICVDSALAPYTAITSLDDLERPMKYCGDPASTSNVYGIKGTDLLYNNGNSDINVNGEKIGGLAKKHVHPNPPHENLRYQVVTFTTGEQSPGTATVDFYYNNGQLATANFEIHSAAQATAVSPSFRPYASPTTLTITGTGFKNAADTLELLENVQVGTTQCTNINIISSTSATCDLPAGTLADVGSLPVTVKPFYSANYSSVETAPSFKNQTITSATGITITPSSTSFAKGGRVHIKVSENGFFAEHADISNSFMDGNSSIAIGSASCTDIQVHASNHISCEKQDSTAGEENTAVSVTVNRSDGISFTEANAITIFSELPPLTLTEQVHFNGSPQVIEWSTTFNTTSLWPQIAVGSKSCLPTLFIPSQQKISCEISALNGVSSFKADGHFHDSINYITDMAYASSRLFVSHFGGIAYSDDNGASWAVKTVQDGLGNQIIQSVDGDGSLIVAGSANGLNISNNSGGSFVHKTVSDGLASNRIQDVLVSGTTIVAATDKEITVSSDSGASWQIKSAADGLIYSHFTALYLDAGKIYLGSIKGGFCVSSNLGVSFSCLSSPVSQSEIKKIAADGSLIYLATDQGLYRSTDGGATFAINTGANNITGLNGIAANGSDVIVTTNQGAHYSADSGASFGSILNTSHGLPGPTLGAHFLNSNFYMATEKGPSLAAADFASFGDSLTKAYDFGSRYGHAESQDIATNHEIFSVDQIQLAATNHQNSRVVVGEVLAGGGSEKEIIVSAPAKNHAGTDGSGAVFIYQYIASAWTLAQTISSPQAAEDGNFGAHMLFVTNLLGEDSLVISAPNEGTGGRVYIYGISNLASPKYTFNSPDAAAELGKHMTSCLATGGDHKTDLILGAPGSNKVWLIDGAGSESAGTYSLSSMASFAVTNSPIENPSGMRFGSQVACLNSNQSTNDHEIFISDPQAGFFEQGSVSQYDNALSFVNKKDGIFGEKLGSRLKTLALGPQTLLAIGTLPEDHPSNGPQTGKLYLFYNFGLTLFTQTPKTLQDYLAGDQAESPLYDTGFGGFGIAAIHDVTGDGYKDYAVGSPLNQQGTLPRVNIFDGKTHAFFGHFKMPATSSPAIGISIAEGELDFTYDTNQGYHLVTIGAGHQSADTPLILINRVRPKTP